MSETNLPAAAASAGADTRQRRRRWRGRPALVVGVVIGLLAVSGTALAYWTTTGSGSATKNTGTSTALTVAQDSTADGMVPGGPAKDVNYTVTNPAAGPQRLTSVTLAITGITWINQAGAGNDTTPANHAAGAGTSTYCTSADFTLTQPDAVGLDLAAGSNTAYTRATAKKSGQIAMVNSASNQDACKDVTVALSITLA